MSTRNKITFDNVNLATTYDLYCNGYKTFNGVTRDVETITIPGRHGALLRDNGRFDTVTLTYEDCGLVRANAMTHLQDLRAFLAKHEDGFYKLKDTYHPDEFRMARYVGPFEPEIGANYDTALFDLVFECQPQRWLTSGDDWTSNNPTSLTNPTGFPASPVIRIYGNGVVTVGSQTITTTGNSGNYIDYDADTMNAFRGTLNKNSSVTVTGPIVLGSGTTNISKGDGITTVRVQPRWWRV